MSIKTCIIIISFFTFSHMFENKEQEIFDEAKYLTDLLESELNYFDRYKRDDSFKNTTKSEYFWNNNKARRDKIDKDTNDIIEETESSLLNNIGNSDRDESVLSNTDRFEGLIRDFYPQVTDLNKWKIHKIFEVFIKKYLLNYQESTLEDNLEKNAPINEPNQNVFSSSSDQYKNSPNYNAPYPGYKLLFIQITNQNHPQAILLPIQVTNQNRLQTLQHYIRDIKFIPIALPSIQNTTQNRPQVILNLFLDSDLFLDLNVLDHLMIYLKDPMVGQLVDQ
ncbi:hypothetical protein HZS_6774 [Henneguya salminicola]|nr:hypothetical protein HZS_6774 [Henneguya salminicola]